MKTISKLFCIFLSLFSIVNTNAYGLEPITQSGSVAYAELMNIVKPNVRNKMYKEFGIEGADYLMTIMSLGYTGGIANSKHTIYSEGPGRTMFINKNVSAAGATDAAVTLTLDATAVDSDLKCYPQVGMEATFSNGCVAKITAQGGTAAVPTFTFLPKSGNIPAIAVLEKIALTSSTFEERTGQPASQIKKWEKFDYTMKISKRSFDTSNSGALEKTWFDDGVNYVEHTGRLMAEAQLMKDISGACLTDTPITNTAYSTALTTGHGAVTGLYPYVTSGAGVSYYTPGFLNRNSFAAMTTYMNGVFAPREFIGFQGSEFLAEFENVLFEEMALSNNSATFLKEGSTIRTKSGVKTGQELDMSFSSLTKAGYKFSLVENRELNDPTMYNAPAYKYTKSCVFMPNSTITTKNSDGNVGDSPYFELLFKENNGESRKMVVKDYAGMRAKLPAATDLDATFHYCLSEYMTAIIGKNKFYSFFSN